MIWHQSANSTGNYKIDSRFYEKFDYTPHFHGNYELIYCISGTCRVDLPNRQCLLSGGQLLLIPPFTVHNFHVTGGSRVWIGVFSRDFIPDFPGDRLYSPFRCDSDTEAFLGRYLFQADNPDRFRTQACLYLVCSECVRSARVLCQTDPQFIDRVLEVVADHLTQDITMAQVARELNYEYHYFSRLFHQTIAMNFREFVSLYRVEYACELLRQTHRSITAVALDCGFQSVRNFNRCFYRFMQVTPSAYRARFPET